MPLYLYSFGYESPRQIRNNLAHGWDDEDSKAVLIEADDKAAALAWGQQISERFVKLLFRDEGVSWLQMGYACGIEPLGETWPGQQIVRVGTFPDFEPWLESYGEEG